MAVTNTVQGLNSVIDLLKNILDTVKDNNDRIVQPRDVSSVSRTTASNKTNIQDLSALNSISKNVQTNAKTYSDVIKTITSNEVISGIRSLAILKMMGFVKAFSGALGLIVEAFNKLNDFKVSKKKIDNFNSVSKQIADSLISITATLYGLAGIVVVAAGIGLLIPVAWPQILIGFAAISATLMGVMMLGLLCAGIITLISKMSKSDGKSSNEIKSLFGDNPSVFKDISILILSMGGIILISALVGLLAQDAYEQILIGFGAIGGTLLITLVIIKFARKVATIDNLMCIAATIIILYALSGLILISSLIGEFVISNWLSIRNGFGALSVILLVLTGVMFVMDKMIKSINTTSLIKSVATIGMLIVVMGVLAGLVYLIANVSQKLASTPSKDIWNTLGMMAGLLGTMMVIAGLIGAFTPLATALAIGGAVILLLSVALGSIVKVMDMMIDVSIKIKKAKAELGEDLFAGLGKAGWQIGWAFTTISAGLAIAVIPLALISPFIGKMKKVINVISNFLDMLSKYTFDGDEMYTVIYDENGKPVKGISINMVRTSQNIAYAFGKFVSILTNEFRNISLIGLIKMDLAFKPISRMMNPIAKFVEILKTFSADDGLISLCTTETDENGNLVTTGTQTLNLSLVAMNIANAFAKFSNELAKGFENIDVTNKMKRRGKRLTAMLDPVVKFVEILTKIEIDEGVTKVTVVGEDGKKTTLNNPLTTINGINKLLTHFSSIFTADSNQLSRREANTLKIQLDAISNLINSIANSVTSLEKLTLKTPVKDNIWETINTIKVYNGKTILSHHANDIDLVVKSWNELDKVIFKKEKDNIKVIERYTEAVNKLSKEFKDVAQSVGMIANAQLNINTTNSSENTVVNKNNQQQVRANQQSTSVESNIPPRQNIDSESIAESIKSGLSGATVKFTFADSMEEFIGEMALS